jgi:hypothetical protein
VIKPNVSELCAIISACLDKDLIINGRAAVVNALAHRRSKLHLKDGSSEYSITPPQMNPAEGPMDVQDVKILASALQQLMATGGAKGGAVSGRKGSEWLVDTAEGQARPVVGKHVVVSMGARGVLWCGPGATRDTGGVKSSPLGGGKADGLDGPADWAHLPAVPVERGVTVTSTNGAGDAFSAGFLHNIVSRATDDDGAALNPKSGGICRDSIQAGLVSAYEAIKKNASKK